MFFMVKFFLTAASYQIFEIIESWLIVWGKIFSITLFIPILKVKFSVAEIVKTIFLKKIFFFKIAIFKRYLYILKTRGSRIVENIQMLLMFLVGFRVQKKCNLKFHIFKRFGSDWSPHEWGFISVILLSGRTKRWWTWTLSWHHCRLYWRVVLAIFPIDKNVEQRICFKFCIANGIPYAESLKMLQKAYCESTLSKTRAYEWYSAFKSGRDAVEDLSRYMIGHQRLQLKLILLKSRKWWLKIVIQI